MKLHKGGMTEREEATLTGGKENEHRVRRAHRIIHLSIHNDNDRWSS